MKYIERAVQRIMAGLADRRLLEAGLGDCRWAWSGSLDGGLRAASARSNESIRLSMAA
jgi:hypothetical protein